MTTIPSVLTLTIPAGQSVSNGQLLLSNGIFAIAMLGSWTSASMSFDVSMDNGTTWQPIYNDAGNETLVVIAAGEIAQLDPRAWAGIPMIRVRSGTHASPVIQSAGASIALFGLANSVAPNDPRRIITPNCYDFVGEFEPYWSTDNDVATFDLTWFLASGEYPIEVTQFGLSVAGGCNAADPGPASRVLGSASISGNMVSQRFGNWQTGIAQIIYQVQMVCQTSLGNTISVYAFVAVNQPPGLC